MVRVSAKMHGTTYVDFTFGIEWRHFETALHDLELLFEGKQFETLISEMVSAGTKCMGRLLIFFFNLPSNSVIKKNCTS